MKIHKIKIEQEEFTPVDLRITIESKRELEFFYALLNIDGSKITSFINENIDDYGFRKFSSVEADDITYGLWSILDDKLKAC